MITTHPAILGLNIENIKQKIQDLENLGFSNPLKMITTHPAILGYTIENIKQKIILLEKLTQRFHLDIIPQEIIEKNLSILGTKIDKLWTLAKVLSAYSGQSNEINNELITKLLFSKLDQVVLADIEITQAAEEKNLDHLWKKIKEIKQQKVPSAKIQETIKGDEGKISRRYAQGYIKYKIGIF